MDYVDGIAIAGTIGTFVSVTFNMVQWCRHRESTKAHKANGQRGFQNMHRVAAWTDNIEDVTRASSDRAPEDRLAETRDIALKIQGAAFAERSAIASFMREHLRCVPRWDHPARPSALFLEPCRKFDIRQAPESGTPETTA